MSPVTVTTRSISGWPEAMHCQMAKAVATLLTMAPTESGNLPGYSFYELLFTSLRIFRLYNLYAYVVSRVNMRFQCGDSSWFIVFNSYNGPADACGLHHQLYALDYTSRVVRHQCVVAHQVGLTFAAVYNQQFGLVAFLGRQFYVSRECGTAKADYTGVEYRFANNIGR